MASYVWLNGQFIQHSEPKAAFPRELVKNHGAENPPCPFVTVNAGVQPAQSSHLDRITDIVVPTVVSHQAAGDTDYNQAYVHLQNSSINQQTGNPVSWSCQRTAHQTPAPNSSFHSQSNTPQAYLKMQNSNALSVCQNVNRAQTMPTDNPSITLPGNVVCNNVQTASNQNHRQFSTQQRFSPYKAPCKAPPDYYSSNCYQSAGTNHSSTRQPLHISGTSQNRQQFPAQFMAAPNTAPMRLMQAASQHNFNDAAPTSSPQRQPDTAYMHFNATGSSGGPQLARHRTGFYQSGQPQHNPTSNMKQMFLNSDTPEDGHSMPFATGPHACPANASTTYGEKLKLILQSNRSMEPVTASRFTGLNGSFSSRHSTQSLPKTNHSHVQVRQNFGDRTPRQISRPKNLEIARTVESGPSNFFHNKGINQGGVSKGNQSKCEAKTPLIEELLRTVDKWSSKVSSVANTETNHASVKPNDNSNHSSPGQIAAPKMVAVVQPLSQEPDEIAAKLKRINEYICITIDENSSNAEKHKEITLREIIDDCRISFENTNQSGSKESAEASCDATVQSELHQHEMLLENCVSPVHPQSDSQRSAPVPNTQNEGNDRCETLLHPSACVSGHSALSTTQWTIESVNKLIGDMEKAPVSSEDPPISLKLIFEMFWGGTLKSLSMKLRSHWYTNLMMEVYEFCNENVTKDTVLLSQVNCTSEKLPENFHVLQDKDVYSELPYTSTWLNINKQLDDIDKDFGFPWCLRPRPQNDGQPDQVLAEDSSPSQTESEALTRDTSRTEPHPVNSEEEERESVSETASPINTDVTDPNDQYYHFKIQVLPPEEARRIFEQTESNVAQTTQDRSVSEEVTNISDKTEPMEVPGAIQEEMTAVTQMEQVCCTEKEKCCGSNTTSGKCQCNKKQSLVPDMISENELKNNKQFEPRLDSKVQSAVEGENQAEGGEEHVRPILTFIWPELYEDVSQDVDLTVDVKDTNDLHQTTMNWSQSSNMLTSDVMDDVPSSPDTETANQSPDQEVGDEVHLRILEISPSGSSDSSETETSESEVINRIDEECGSLTSPDVADTLPKHEEQTQVDEKSVWQRTLSPMRKQEMVKRKRENSHGSSFPVNEKKKKREPRDESVLKRRKIHANGPELLATTSVKLVLFGSANRSSSVHRSSHRSLPQTESDATRRPPEVISIDVCQNKTAKQRIYENWSLPPSRIKHKSKLKTLRSMFRASLSQEKHVKRDSTPSKDKDVSASPELDITDKASKPSDIQRNANILRTGEREVGKWPTYQDRTMVARNGRRSNLPLQETDVLKFCTLPNTFTFPDRDKVKETTEHVSGNALLSGPLHVLWRPSLYLLKPTVPVFPLCQLNTFCSVLFLQIILNWCQRARTPTSN